MAAPRDQPPAGTGTSSSSRSSSLNRQTTDHRPQQPSGLRQSYRPPPSPNPRLDPTDSHSTHAQIPTRTPAEPQVNTSDSRGRGHVEEPDTPVDARTALLGMKRTYDTDAEGGDSDGGQGPLSPTVRPRHRRTYGSFGSQASYPASAPPSRQGLTRGSTLDGTEEVYASGYVDEPLATGVLDSLLGRKPNKSTTAWLARSYGLRNTRWMYMTYYFPFFNWITQYKWSYLRGDLIAALTMASFYIPISLSYATNLGHIPAVNGLYSFVFNPLIYAFLGTCPQMVVGPEAAGSLLTGGVVKEAINGRSHHDNDDVANAQVAGMVTGLAGAIILAAGIARLGFLDSVLSRPFLRGFISAIGVVIFADQLIPELGLDTAASHSQTAHGSSLDKIRFLIAHAGESHRLTALISFITVVIVLTCRSIKNRFQERYKWMAYIPDRFIVVVLSAVISWKYDWEGQGVDILNDIKAKGTPFTPEWPFKEHNFKHVDDAFGTGFVIALLGFFESSVAAKSIKPRKEHIRKTVKLDDGREVEVEEEADGIKGMTISPNRELLALGVANVVGGVFMALPAFGGYGRSKVNASTGGKTPMSSVFLSLITLFCVLFLLPYFYYIPKAVLSAMITVVSISLVEEAPHDIIFFYRISGWIELCLMALVFFTTFLWNLRIGIAVGIGLSLLRLLKHAARPRIQILGRVPGTNEFENAEAIPDSVEFIPNCLIVKIPEPLTFANTGSLKDRLRRLEIYGTNTVHPALPRLRKQEHNQNIVFDIHGVTGMDPAASQVLLEIVKDYVERGTRVFFCRIPSRRSEVWRLMRLSGIMELCGGEAGFFVSVEEALKATERSRTLQDIVGSAAVDEESGVEGTPTGARSPVAVDPPNTRRD